MNYNDPGFQEAYRKWGDSFGWMWISMQGCIERCASTHARGCPNFDRPTEWQKFVARWETDNERLLKWGEERERQ